MAVRWVLVVKFYHFFTSIVDILIGGSRRVHPACTPRPQQDPILLFSPKSTHIRGQHPQWLGAPPMGNPGSTTELPLADLGGRAWHMPPYGTQFFRFCIHFHQKVPTSEVHAPPNGCTPPLQEILDPPLITEHGQVNIMLEIVSISFCYFPINFMNSYARKAGLIGCFENPHVNPMDLPVTSDLDPNLPANQQFVYCNKKKTPLLELCHFGCSV